MKSRVAQVFLVVVAVLFLGRSVSAQVQSSAPTWPSSRIVLAVSGSLDNNPRIEGDFRQALKRSVSLWNASADLRIELIDSDDINVSEKGFKGDGVSLLTAASTAKNLSLFPKLSDSPAAVTRVFADSRGNITEADIALNPFVKFSTDGSYGTFDLQDTFSHEIGHLLGLRHSPVSSSIMFDSARLSLGPGSYAGSVTRLPESDATQIRALYGPQTQQITCCASLVGRVFGLPLKAKQVHTIVWLEERETGRLISALEPNQDGTYFIGGLEEGRYRLFARSSEKARIAFSQQDVRVVLTEVSRHDFSLTYSELPFRSYLIGSTPQLSRIAVPAFSGRPLRIFLGGEGSSSEVVRIYRSGDDFANPDMTLSLSPDSIAEPVKMIGFTLSNMDSVKSGQYTLVIEFRNGAKDFMIGALSVSEPKVL